MVNLDDKKLKNKEIIPEEEIEGEIRPLSLSEWSEQIRAKMQPKTKEVV